MWDMMQPCMPKQKGFIMDPDHDGSQILGEAVHHVNYIIIGISLGKMLNYKYLMRMKMEQCRIL